MTTETCILSCDSPLPSNKLLSSTGDSCKLIIVYTREGKQQTRWLCHASQHLHARTTEIISGHLYNGWSCSRYLPGSPWYRTQLAHLLPCKDHLHVGVYQVLVLPNESLLHISHDAGVHTGQSLCSIDLDVETSPLPLRRDAIREEEVPATSTDKAGNSRRGWQVCQERLTKEREAAPLPEHRLCGGGRMTFSAAVHFIAVLFLPNLLFWGRKWWFCKQSLRGAR